MLNDKQSIQVTIRVRPLSQKQKTQDSRICVDVQQQNNSISTFFSNQTNKFTFDSICNNNTQQDVFQKVGKKSTIHCLQGYNCTIFAYGQTGSGKTFTMMGINQQSQNYQNMRGLIPRTLEYLFQSIDEQMKSTGSRYLISCSFLEIYNQQIIDLLNKNNCNLQIREDIRKGVYVEGVTEQTIEKSQQALDILSKGSKGRHVGSTCYNQTSSRSHSVFTMQISSKHQKNGIVNTKVRHFHFIDLAGSERTKNINGERLKEGKNINTSLFHLGKVINSLAQSSEGKNKHINYRDSKLTFLLKDSLGGNSKTHLIANISPCTISYNQTNMTLKFAKRVKRIKLNKASINEDATGNLQSLKNQIKRLMQQNILLRNDRMNPLQISRRSQRGQIASDTKMALMLNQYVSDQIDKQAKFTVQVSKLNKKVQNLQNAVKRYSDNQIQLRMIVRIYEDKIKKIKTLQNQIEMNGKKIIQNQLYLQETQKSISLDSYLQSQRQLLLNQIEFYKKLTSNQVSIKNFLKSIKLFQNDQNLQQILTKNGQFLSELKNQLQKVQKLKPEQQPNNQIVESKLAQMNQDNSRRQIQYLQKIQFLEQMISDAKLQGQQNQQLLKEAIDHQINLQEKNKQQQTIIFKLSQDQVQSIQKISIMQSKIRQFQIQKQNLQKCCQDFKLQLKQKVKSIQELKFKQSQSLNQWVQKLEQKSAQVIQLKKERLNLQAKNQEVVQKIREINIKVQELQSNNNILLTAEDNYKSQLRGVLSSLGQQRNQQIEKNKQIEKLKLQIQSLNQIVSQKQQVISRLEESLYANSIIIINFQKQAQHLNKNITQYQTLIKQKSTQIQNQQQRLIRYQQNTKQLEKQVKRLQSNLQNNLNQLQESEKSHKQKIEELMNIIDSMESSDNKNHQQINNIRISVIKLQQLKQQLQFKLKSQLEKSSKKQQDLTQTIQNLTACVKEKDLAVKQQKMRTNQLKKDLASIRQAVRLGNIQLEQSRSQTNHLKLKLQNLSEQNTSVIQKGKLVRQQLSKMQKELNEQKSSVKMMENQLYIKQKTFSVEKDSLQKELKLKQEKCQNYIKQTERHKIKLNKQIQQYKSQILTLQKHIQNQRQTSSQTQSSLKQNMDQCLMKKQKQLVELKQKNDQIKSALHISNMKCQQFDLQIKNYAQKQSKLQAKVDQLKTQNQKLLQQIKEKAMKQEQLRQNLQQFKNLNQSELQELQFQHVSQLDSKNQKIQELNNKIQQLQTQIKVSLEQNQNKQLELKIIQGNLNTSTLQIEKLHKQTLELQIKIQSKDKSIHQLLVSIENMKLSIQKQQNFILQKNHYIQQKQLQICSLKQNFQDQLEQKESSICSLKQALNLEKNQYHKENLFLQEKLKQSQQILQNIQRNQIQTLSQLQKTQRRCSQIQNSLFREITDKQVKKQQYQKYCLQLSRQNQVIAKQKKVCQSMVEAKSNQILQMYKQITNLNAYIKQQRSESVTTLNTHIQEYKARLDQQKDRFQVTLQNLNEVNLQLQQTVKQLQRTKEQATQARQQIKKNRQENIILLQDLCSTKSDLQIVQKQNTQFKLVQQSYNSLQSINRALGKKCEQLEKTCNAISQKLENAQSRCEQLQCKCQLFKEQEEQAKKQQLQLIQTQKKYNYERQLNSNLKTLIQNSQSQKRQLLLQLQQKNCFYNDLLQKLSKNQSEAKRVTNSEHYVKTVQLLEKSRCQQVQLKKSYQQLKKTHLKLKEEFSKKQDQIQQIKKKTEQYCRTISHRNQDTERDYMELQKRYEQLYKDKKVLQKVLVQNQNLKNANSRSSLKIQELQEKLKNINYDYLELENEIQQHKKKALHSGNLDQKWTTYINKLKSQINDLKRQKQIISESLMKETNQKVILKSQIRHTNQSNVSIQSQIKSELEKKLNQVKYLQQIISETLQACKIKRIQPRAKLQTIKSSIVNCIRENVKQNQQLKRRIRQLQSQVQYKQKKFTPYEKSDRDPRQKSNSMFTSLHEKYKQQNEQNSKQSVTSYQNKKNYNIAQEPLCNIMRSKINKSGNKYSQIRQSVDGGVLKSKDIFSNSLANKNYHQ